MIFYFSATGNSEYVARSVLIEGESLISIEDAVRKNQYRYTVSDERIGIVSPTYDWTVPSIVREFIEQLELSFAAKPYTFYVGTYGTTIGGAAKIAAEMMRAKGYPFDALFDIRMPDTWTPIFDLSDKEKVAERNRRADAEISELKRLLVCHAKGDRTDSGTPCFTGKIGQFIYNKWVRNTANLTVTEDCIGCGLCAKKCPVSAIEIQDKKPVWVKKQCVMCLGCLHHCPKFAIECGKNTRRHGQYCHEPF